MNYPWKRILVPTDFSECSDRALALAAQLARANAAQILLVHVADLALIGGASTMTYDAGGVGHIASDVAREGGLKACQAQAERVAPAAKVSFRVRAGDTKREILAAADELGADAIVIGTHGRTGLSHVLLGSVAESIVRHAPIPVVTVRHAERDRPHLVPEEARLLDEREG